MAEEPELNPIIAERRSSADTITKLSVDFQYLQRDIREIKSDIKDIKNDNITRREFDDRNKDFDKRISFVTGVMYTIGLAIILAFVAAVIKLVIK